VNDNIRVGNLFGIPFYVNPSWFLVLGLVTLSYGGQLAQFPQLTGLTPWILGLITALLLFGSVLAHELGHSFMALSQKIGVKSITLFIFGGLATLEKESATPLQAFLVAIAGPAVSLLLSLSFFLLGTQVPLPLPLGAIVSLVATMNLALALFNLIPGLPLDGGNVLKALVWKITGNPNRGVIFASRVGQVFGWVAIIIGGLAILGLSPVGSFWTMLIGFFLLQNAGNSAQSAQVQEILQGLTAADALTPNSPLVAATLNLREFANDYVIGQNQWRRFIVIDSQGLLLGVINVEDLKTVPTSVWPTTSVSELMQSPSSGFRTILPQQSLLEVIQILEQQNLQELAVVREDGFVLGLLEKNSIISLLQKQVLKTA
jgi:Zn-dependent protease